MEARSSGATREADCDPAHAQGGDYDNDALRASCRSSPMTERPAAADAEPAPDRAGRQRARRRAAEQDAPQEGVARAAGARRGPARVRRRPARDARRSTSRCVDAMRECTPHALPRGAAPADAVHRQADARGRCRAARDGGRRARLGRARDSLALHQAERWRAELIADDAATTRFAREHANADLQQLRALVRNARKDAAGAPEQRSGRAYRELFQFIRAHEDDV